MKKYQVTIYSDEIEEVDVVSETEKFVTFESKRKAAKETEYGFIADLPIDAAKWLVNKWREKHDENMRNFSRSNKKLEAAIALRKSIEVQV